MPSKNTWMIVGAGTAVLVAGGLGLYYLLANRNKNTDDVVEIIELSPRADGTGLIPFTFRGKKGSAEASVTWPAMTYTQTTLASNPARWNVSVPTPATVAEFPAKWLPVPNTRAYTSDPAWSITNPAMVEPNIPMIMLDRVLVVEGSPEMCKITLAPYNPDTDSTGGFSSPGGVGLGSLTVNTPMTTNYTLAQPLQ